MKVLFLLLLLPAFAKAQQDFDYTIFTRHAKFPAIHDKDSTGNELLLERRIVKEANRLIIIPVMNTGDADEYALQFVGFSLVTWLPEHHGPTSSEIENTPLQYQTKDRKYIFLVWPMLPCVEIREYGTSKLLQTYY